MIEVQSIVKRYGSTTAVDGVSFQAQPGEIFGLIGPNGAGKSTTIRMLMNIILPDEGKILFSGKPLSTEDKDRIGYLPEERGLYKKMQVNEALLYLASLKGASDKDSQTEIDRWLATFELTEWKKAKIQELSKGMAQKIQFIGAIAHKPELIFFDEPFSGLDPVAAETLLEAMIELRNQGRTVLFSTHIMEHAERICDRIFLINRGKEVVYGKLNEVKERFGNNSVHVNFDGNAEFVKQLDCLSQVSVFPKHFEAEIANGHTSDELFKAIAGKLSVQKFERMTPSLHAIFLKLVGHAPEAVPAEDTKKGATR